MEYRAVGDRCAVDLSAWNFGVPMEKVTEILQILGFEEIPINVPAVALTCKGTSTYRRGARPSEAPAVVDCSSFVKWVYGQHGIWLPRRTIQQHAFGATIQIERRLPGDVVFVSGHINYYDTNSAAGIGHVGILIDKNTVLHAANSKVGIIETSYNKFVNDSFRGIRRYIPYNRNIRVFKTPPEREVECSSDFRWIILQQLG